MLASTPENRRKRAAARAAAGRREQLDQASTRWYDDVAVGSDHDRRAEDEVTLWDDEPSDGESWDDGEAWDGEVRDGEVRDDEEWDDEEWDDGEGWDDGEVWDDEGWHGHEGADPTTVHAFDFWDDGPPRRRRLRLTRLRRRLPVRLALAAAAVLVAAAIVGANRSPGGVTTEDATPTTIDDGAAGDLDTISGQRLATDGATPTTGPPTLPRPSGTGPTMADGDGTAAEDGGTAAGAMDDTADHDHGATAGGTTAVPGGDYAANLAMIRRQTVRNRAHDDSPYRDTPSDELVPSNHYGPRSEYLNNPGGNPEQSFPIPEGGQFRAGCEFSHFAYDDPLVFPGQPGAAHLHMFFGNTDVNAHTTADSLLNSGSSTCNGQELNRTGYWAPAMFDGAGNVRIPERVVVYYKGEGLANGKAEVFPDGAAMIASDDINTIDGAIGGAAGKFNFVCSDQWSGEANPASNTMPACDGNRFLDLYGVRTDPHVVLEMNVKFPQCWNGKDPTNHENFRRPANGSWYYSQCNGEFGHTLVNLEYFINYKVEIGENTRDWYLASDVDPTTKTKTGPGGHSIHADWWSGWHRATNQQWIDNCVNHRTSTASGCGFGYLTDGGPDGSNPKDGPALKYRPQYTGPSKVPATQLYEELCPGGPAIATPTAAAHCRLAGVHHHG